MTDESQGFAEQGSAITLSVLAVLATILELFLVQFALNEGPPPNDHSSDRYWLPAISLFLTWQLSNCLLYYKKRILAMIAMGVALLLSQQLARIHLDFIAGYWIVIQTTFLILIFVGIWLKRRLGPGLH